MKFIELTCLDDSKVFVNMDNAFTIFRGSSNLKYVTAIGLDGDSVVRVKETPDEIFAKIKEHDNDKSHPSIGGANRNTYHDSGRYD